MQTFLFTPFAILRRFYGQGNLIWQLAKRQVIGRYKGSFLGILWSFFYPLLMLATYTFVFSVVFKARWGVSANESKLEFALTLFCGLIVFQLFSENVSRAPGLILENPNFVKKVIFPLEILPLSSLVASLVHTLISVVILLLGVMLFLNHVPWSAIYLPLVMLPLLLLSLGLTWFLSSLGVFVRDLQQMIGVVVQLLMFLSPIFYPVSALPETVQSLMLANPLSGIIENFRRVLIWNQPPQWHWLLWETLLGLGVAVFGYWWFEKTRKGFADVI